MERILRGKYLVRPSTLKDGTKVLTLTGVFHPMNFEVSDVEGSDEMWVSDIIISSGGIRFTEPIGRDGGSPEDFLEGENQSPRSWKKRSEL